MITSQPRTKRSPTETLEDLIDSLLPHTWSHSCNNFRDYILAIKKEDELFSRAMHLGAEGLCIFREHKEESIMNIVASAVRQAENDLAERFNKRIDALRDKYMTPLDVYKEKLEHHDWHYRDAEETKVFNRGAVEQHQLVLEAELQGQEWIDAYCEMHVRRRRTLAHWEKLVALAKADTALAA